MVSRLGGTIVDKANARVSMADVAARAGVSVTTVSHVLNNVPGKRIRPDTRDRVRLAAEDLGYVLNGVARSLGTRRSHAIAMIGDAIATTPHAVRIILGAHEAASKLGWLLVHTDTGGDRSFELAEIQALQQRQVDGFLYARLFSHEVTLPAVLNGLPTVLMGATCADRSISSVVPDDFGGGQTATRELVRHGHAKIAFINNAEGIPAAHVRLAAYRSVLDEAGVPYRAEYVVHGVPDPFGGLRAARTLLDLDDPPQAIFSFNDRMAMGVYRAAHEYQVRIPDELSIVGFDNQDPIVDGLFPGLTTVALPHYEMGAWAVRTLIDQIEHPEDNAPSQVSLACPLVPRESIAAPAGRGAITLSTATAKPAPPKSGQGAAGPSRAAASTGNRGWPWRPATSDPRMNTSTRLGRVQVPAASSDLPGLYANCVCAAQPSEEEVRDFCSLLSLADRVLLASADADTAATRLLSVYLDELGFPAQVVDQRTMHLVQPYDTVVVICSSEADPSLMDLLRPALHVGAVLLAVTARRPRTLLRLSDAAITIPPAASGSSSDQGSPQVSFSLMSIIAVDAIRRDLVRRRRAVRASLATGQHRHLLDVSSPAALLPEQLPTQ